MTEFHIPDFFSYLFISLGVLWFGGIQIILCAVSGWLCGVYSGISVARGILCGFGVGITMVAVIFIANVLASGVFEAVEWVGQVVAPILTLVGGPLATIRCCVAWNKMVAGAHADTP